jgi:glutathione S-transferase
LGCSAIVKTGGEAMKLYHFPSPNPQKVHLAILELGLECELVPIDLTKGEQRKPEFLALNPCGRVPVLTDGDVTVSDSHAILAYLGDKTGKLWPGSAAGRASALQWLFFLSAHVSPPVTDLAFNRIAAKLLGLTPDEGAIARGEQAMPAVIGILEGHLAKGKWMLSDEFSLVDCAFGPVLNALEKARFSFADFPKVRTYLEGFRSRPSWQATPRLPML